MQFKQLLFCSLLCAAISLARAQTDTLWVFHGLPTTIEDIEAKPGQFPAFVVAVGPSTITRPLGDADFCGALQLRYRLPAMAEVYGRFDHHLARNFDTQYRWLADNEDIRTSNTLRPYTYAELGVLAGLSANVKSKQKLAVRTANAGGQRKLFEKEHNLSSTRMFRGRLGALRYTSLLNNFFYPGQTLRDADGNTVSETGPLSIRHRNPGPTYLTSFSSTGAFVGFQVSWVRRVQFTVNDRYRQEESNHIRGDQVSLFADFIPVSAIVMDDLQVNGQSYDVLHANGDGFEYRSWGWRAGLELEAFRGKRHGYAFQCEVGMRPGISNSGYDVPPLGKKLFAQTRFLYLFAAK